MIGAEYIFDQRFFHPQQFDELLFNNQFIPATGVKDSKESSYSLSGPRAVPGTVKFTEFVKILETLEISIRGRSISAFLPSKSYKNPTKKVYSFRNTCRILYVFAHDLIDKHK